MLLWQNPYLRSDENRRSYTLLPRNSEPTNEREQNQACLYFAERGGGRRSQPRDANGTNSGNDKPPTITYQQRWQPVTTKQVYAVIWRYPDMFVKAEGRIMLMI